jgi:hypothetical protein
MHLSLRVCSVLALSMTAALLTACGGSQSPLGLSGSQQNAMGTQRNRAWMSPAAKTSKELLYVSSFNNGDINVYSYPKGTLVGQLTGFNGPVGMCVDANGDIFVPERFSGSVYEYAHGGTTPIATLDDGNESGTCSIDPTTGNLAVGDITSGFTVFPYSGSGAFGSPEFYSNPGGVSWNSINNVGYDDKGNLFFSGSAASIQTEGELPKGSSDGELLTISGLTIESNGEVQWDGKYITFTDRDTANTYEVAVSGSTGKVVSELQLNLTSDQDRAGWISTKLKTDFVPQFNSNEVLVFKYPSGKQISKRTISSSLDGAWGVTLSIAPKK